jgi:hypothetical protein
LRGLKGFSIVGSTLREFRQLGSRLRVGWPLLQGGPSFAASGRQKPRAPFVRNRLTMAYSKRGPLTPTSPYSKLAIPIFLIRGGAPYSFSLTPSSFGGYSVREPNQGDSAARKPIPRRNFAISRSLSGQPVPFAALMLGTTGHSRELCGKDPPARPRTPCSELGSGGGGYGFWWGFAQTNFGPDRPIIPKGKANDLFFGCSSRSRTLHAPPLPLGFLLLKEKEGGGVPGCPNGISSCAGKLQRSATKLSVVGATSCSAKRC